MNKELKRLSKQIYKNYFKENNQHLYIGTDIIFDGISDNRCEVYIVDYRNDKRLITLFELVNLSFADSKDDLSKLSNSPKFSIQEGWRQIILKKFGNITKQDIKDAVDYFLWEILDIMIFNVVVYLDYEVLEQIRKDINGEN